MADWNSKQYLKFKKERTQPATDLAMRVRSSSPRSIIDIGCGPGNSTRVLKDIFPDAEILGVDSSPNMIEKARSENPDIEFALCDALSLSGKYDLIFSNACLQWIPDHMKVIPSLMKKLNDGGILAVQMPANSEEPLFKLIKETADEFFQGEQNPPVHPSNLLSTEQYFNILTACSSSFEIWETKYHHSVRNHAALVEFVESTRLRPYLNCMSEERGAEFKSEIAKRAEALYPVMANGEVVLGFRRLFFTAVKKQKQLIIL